MADRKTKNLMRLISNFRSGNSDSASGEGGSEIQVQEIVGFRLGYRVLLSEQAEIWTIQGMLSDSKGGFAKEGIGELSFVLVPGESENAIAVTGFISPPKLYLLNMSEEKIRRELVNLVTQLGYDQEGYYFSVGIGSKSLYQESPRLLSE